VDLGQYLSTWLVNNTKLKYIYWNYTKWIFRIFHYNTSIDVKTFVIISFQLTWQIRWRFWRSATGSASSSTCPSTSCPKTERGERSSAETSESESVHRWREVDGRFVRTGARWRCSRGPYSFDFILIKLLDSGKSMIWREIQNLNKIWFGDGRKSATVTLIW